MASSYSPNDWMAIALISAICLPALYTFYRRVGYRFRRRNSSTWNLTTTITLSTTIMKIGRGEGPWEVTMLYSYRTDEYQSGEQKKIFMNESEALELVTSISNRQLPVRFDPMDQSVSELVFD
jgi:hypothetical protein